MNAQSNIAQQTSASLPLLRKDIEIELIAERGQGFPSVLVTDPVRGAYFKLSWPESALFLHWEEGGSVDGLKAKISNTYGAKVEDEAIAGVADFAFTNQLTQTDQAGGWQRYSTLNAAGRHGVMMTLVHSYLFFRIPLINPDDALKRLLPAFSFVFKSSFWYATAILGAIGVYLTTRQWNSLLVAAQDAMQLQTLTVYAIAILCLKAIHELGHALTTAHLGCRVPSMGIAFMLGTPVLYTDTSDSWRLSRRQDRLAIVFGGVAAEMIVAVLAILLWSFLPDGVVRQLCFAFATSSIALSLAVNLNPFMRFDGYYALSDWLGVPNLQARSFSLMTWRLRELLFDLRLPPPENMSRSLRSTLLIYAVLVTIYRFSLYTGIVIVVYTVFGKALGIPLALFEIVVFILRPILSEITAWWTLRHEIVARFRVIWLAAGVSFALVVVCVPWMGVVEAPAVIVATEEEEIHLSQPAQLTSINVTEGQFVAKGDILFATASPDIEQQWKKAHLQLRLARLQVARWQADEKERQSRHILESKLARAQEKVAALDRQRVLAVVRAPFDGRVVDIDSVLSAGVWVGPKHALARVIASGGSLAKSILLGAQIDRIAEGAQATFIPDDAAGTRSMFVVKSIAPVGQGKLSEAALADRYGGLVPVSEVHGELLTKNGWFEVTLSSDQDVLPSLVRGVLWIEGNRVSPIFLAWRGLGQIFAREHTF